MHPSQLQDNKDLNYRNPQWKPISYSDTNISLENKKKFGNFLKKAANIIPPVAAVNIAKKVINNRNEKINEARQNLIDERKAEEQTNWFDTKTNKGELLPFAPQVNLKNIPGPDEPAFEVTGPTFEFVEELTFWEKYKKQILIGGGILTALGLHYVMSNKKKPIRRKRK
jgi:hypothetical protein